MAIVFRAVLASSLNDARMALYAVEAQLADQYDLCERAGLLLDKRWPLTVWSEAADDLRKRLEGMPRPGRTEWSDREYRRGRLVEQIVELLDRAGRSGEVVPFYESELAAGSSHERLVGRSGWTMPPAVPRKASRRVCRIARAPAHASRTNCP